ncbi:MAG: MgtC/SapB family protein [Deltaproteobacteria bacterium]|nr:MAG: MgtC/SapB family protein [Deltaproteobacteria bacterium]
MDLSPYEPYASLAVVVAVGLLIGLERERRPVPGAGGERGDRSARHAAGARTFPLIGLLGALAGLLLPATGWWLAFGGLIGVIVFGVLAYRQEARIEVETGLTTEVAMAVTYLLGVLGTAPGLFESVNHKLIAVAMLGVGVTALLSAKPILHRLAARASQEDVIATVKFLIVAVIVLPLLPDRNFGPYEVLNPREIGWMVVLIAGISFAGYVAARAYGSRGLGLTGILGGLVSSTAVAASFSPRARSHPELHPALSLAVVGASSLMFPRVVVEVAIVGPSLLPTVAVPMGVMGAAGLALSVWTYRRGTKTRAEPPELPLKNPFELGTALTFGLVYAFVLVLSKAATDLLGSGGTYLVGLIAGTTDVDAITLSMARLARSAEVSRQVAATTIFLGAVSNTLVKAGIAVVLGGVDFGRRVALAFVLILASGALATLALWLV